MDKTVVMKTSYPRYWRAVNAIKKAWYVNFNRHGNEDEVQFDNNAAHKPTDVKISYYSDHGGEIEFAGPKVDVDSAIKVFKATASSDIDLSLVRVVKTIPNSRYMKDRRRKFTWVVIEYRGSDGNEYRKGFYFEKGMDTHEMDKLIPRHGSNKEIARMADKPFYKKASMATGGYEWHKQHLRALNEELKLAHSDKQRELLSTKIAWHKAHMTMDKKLADVGITGSIRLQIIGALICGRRPDLAMAVMLNPHKQTLKTLKQWHKSASLRAATLVPKITLAFKNLARRLSKKGKVYNYFRTQTVDNQSNLDMTLGFSIGKRTLKLYVTFGSEGTKYEANVYESGPYGGRRTEKTLLEGGETSNLTEAIDALQQAV